jgi:hypothetical protein
MTDSRQRPQFLRDCRDPATVLSGAHEWYDDEEPEVREFPRGPVAGLVGIEGGVVPGCSTSNRPALERRAGDHAMTSVNRYIDKAGDRLLGTNVVIDPFMPDIGANACPVAFGDFKSGYLIVDRIGIRVLRDSYTAKPLVLFYSTKRTGGAVVDSCAIKLIKCA